MTQNRILRLKYLESLSVSKYSIFCTRFLHLILELESLKIFIIYDTLSGLQVNDMIDDYYIANIDHFTANWIGFGSVINIFTVEYMSVFLKRLAFLNMVNT